MGSYRRARRQERAREFGRRHPRFTAVIAVLLMAGVGTVCGFLIRHGSYLGRGWLVAAFAGVVAAAVLAAAVLITGRPQHRARRGVQLAWLVLALFSATAIRFPFPAGSSGGAQAFFNVMHAAALGYEAATCAALAALFAYLLISPRGIPGRLQLRQPPALAATQPGLLDVSEHWPRRPWRRVLGWPGWVLAGAVAGLVAGVVLAVIGGPRGHHAASTAGGFVILLSLAAMCVAGSAALYRRFRSGRVRREVVSLRAASPVADPSGPADRPRQDPAR